MLSAQTFAFVLATASAVSAHFQLESPLPRNNGGMDAYTRVNYSSIVNSTILATFYWDGVNDIYLGSGENPQEFPYKLGSFNAKSGKGYKIPIDLSSVPASVLKLNEKLTIQIVCHQQGFDLYQCADVVYDIAPPAATTTAAGVASTTGGVAVATTVAPTQILSSARQVGLSAAAFAAALFI
ncbi:hypothetical protein BDR26DRAFT_855903 [Obelidium mucronatum]|nr:hypothetical protein BDR26DRAFT_855903 [Obelidium mucronatum]